MKWENILKAKSPSQIAKDFSPVLEKLDKKTKKRVKRTLQAAQPTEFFGQDFTKLSELIDVMKDLDLIKSDNTMKKKILSIDEQNLDLVAQAATLRKKYESLYMRLRGMVYPRRKGDLRDE